MSNLKKIKSRVLDFFFFPEVSEGSTMPIFKTKLREKHLNPNFILKELRVLLRSKIEFKTQNPKVSSPELRQEPYHQKEFK